MTYAPGLGDVAAPMVSAYTFGWSATAHEAGLPNVPTSTAWEGNNRAVYCPILVPVTCVVRRLWWANGATVNASYNLDCGVYADGGYKPGSRLVSTGSTAQGTASEVQFVNVTDTVLPPGLYWIALVCSTTSATVFRSQPANTGMDAAFRMDQDSALPLPATATPVESQSNHVWVCGFATTASP